MNNRILVLTNNIFGLYCFRKEVMKAIIDAGNSLYISEPDNDKKSKYFEDIGCKIIKTNFNRRSKNPFHDLKLLIKYIQIIHQVKPQVVLTYTIKPNIFGGIACRMTRTPQIANITGLGDAIENKGWLQTLTIHLYRVGLAKTSRIFFQNLHNKVFCVKAGIASKESIVLPGSGVNLEYHKYQPYPKDNGIKFLFIARLLKDKGIEEYLEMAITIKKKYPKTEFQILGYCEENYQNQIEKLTKEGIIQYFGLAPDVRPFLTNVHCTILPSYHEGMSNVNLESAANGRPVITTNVPGCMETVEDNITGYLIKPRDTDDLIQKVEKFINLPYEKKKEMGMSARKKVEQEFDRKIIVDAYLSEIDRVKN